MPRHKSLITVIRDLVRREVTTAVQALIASVTTTTGRGRRRRRGPGRPPGSKNKKRRGRPRKKVA